MTSKYFILKSPQLMHVADSSLYSEAFQEDPVQQIESVYYRMKFQNGSSISEIFRSHDTFGSDYPNKDSLRYSHSPEYQEQQFRVKQHADRDRANSESKPTSLISFKQKKPQVSQVQKFLLNHQHLIPRPPFSAINTFNPAFRRLQEIKKQLNLKMSNGELWLRRGANEQSLAGTFYSIPTDQLLEVVSESTNECNMQSMILAEYSGQNSSLKNQQFYPNRQKECNQDYQITLISARTPNICDKNTTSSNISKNIHHFETEKNIQQFSKDIVEKKNLKLYKKAQSSSEDGSSHEKQEHQVLQSRFREENSQNFVIDQINLRLKSFNQMTYEQLTSQVVKHLKILEDFNDSVSSQQNIEKKQSEKQKQIQEKSPFIQYLQPGFNDQIQFAKQSQIQNSYASNPYLRSSQGSKPLTLSRKRQILHKFNQEQAQMMNKMIESMILFRDLQNNSRSNSTKIEWLNQNNKSDNQEVSISQHSLKRITENIKGAIHPNRYERAMFNLESSQDANSQGTLQKIAPSPGNSLQFKKLEPLMRDRQMKKSILQSLGMDSSVNNHSFISIVQKELEKETQTDKEEIHRSCLV